MIASRVCDASVLVAFLAHDGDRGAAAREALTTGIVAAPSLVDLEVLHALRGRWLGGRLSEDQLEPLAGLLMRTPLLRYPVQRLGPQILRYRHNLTIYDASYVVLAETLGVELVTFDRGMAAVPGARCSIRLL